MNSEPNNCITTYRLVLCHFSDYIWPDLNSISLSIQTIYSEKIYFCVQTILMVSPFPLPLPLPQQINLFFVCFLILGKYNNFFGFYAYFSTINNPFLWNQCSLFRSCINFYCELCSKLLAKYIIDLTPNLFCFSNKYFFRLIYKKFYLLSSELWMR